MNLEIAKSRVNRVIQQDTNANSEADFLATHIPFEGIKIRNGGSSVDEYRLISEEDLFEKAIKTPGDVDQLIVIYGSSGSGKSHLIRWFASKFSSFDHENETVIYIRRSDNSLKGTIRQLLDLDEIKDLPNKEIYKRLSEAGHNIGSAELKNKIYYSFLSKIKSDENTEILSRIDKMKLLALLSNQDFQDRFFNASDFNGPIDRIYRKVVPSEHTKGTNDVPALFTAADFELDNDFILRMQEQSPDAKAISLAEKLNTYDNSSAEKAEQIAKYLNRFVDGVIQEIAGLQPDDFENIFGMIREELYRKNKNLTLLIEDITAFTGVNEALLNVLINKNTGTSVESGRHMCRLSSVIGTTTQYYNGFRENLIERVAKEIYIEDDLVTKNQDSLVRFVAQYLNAISLTEDELVSWLHDGADYQKLPVHEITQGHNWDYVKINNEIDLPLYPFTRYSLVNLFNSLNEDKRTPRYVLSDIVRLALNNIINEPSRYPSFSINPRAIVGLNNNEQSYMMNQVGPEDQKRLISFICIWGDGSINDYYDTNNQRFLSGIKYDVFEELGFKGIKGIAGNKPVPQSQPVVSKDSTNNQKTSNSIQPKEKKNDAYEYASTMINQWALGDGHFEDSRNTYKKSLEEFIYSSVDWQAAGVSYDNAQKVKSYGLIEIERSTRNTIGLYRIVANNENAAVMDALAKWLLIGGSSWDYDGSENDIFTVTRWLYSNQTNIINLVKTYDGERPVTYADYALSYYAHSILFRGNDLKVSDPGLLLKSLLDVSPDSKNNFGVHCEEWNSFRESFGADGEVYDVVSSYYNLFIDERSKKMFLCRNVVDSHINRLLKNEFRVTTSEVDYVTDRQKIVNKTRAIYPNIHNVLVAEEKYAKECVKTIVEELDLSDSDISLLDESLISDLRGSVLEYIDAIKKADRQSCINCVDMSLLKEIYDNRDKVCSSAKQLYSAFQAPDDFKKLIKYAKNPLYYLDKLAVLLAQLRSSVDQFHLEYESSRNKSFIDSRSILLDTKDEAVNRIEDAKKTLNRLGGKK